MEDLDELLNHLTQTTRLSPDEARRVVREVIAFHTETVEQFVVRRHQEMQADRLTNPVIFERLSKEIEVRRFCCPSLSTRQLRRIIYG